MKDRMVREPKDTTVRPRQVWFGIVLGLIALILTGVGLMMTNHWLAWGSACVIVLGLLISWRGGVEYDTRGQEPPHHELREVLEAGEHEGVSPYSRVVDDEAQHTAAHLTERKEELLTRSATSSAPSWRFFAAYGLIGIGAWLLVGQWFLGYPFTISGQDSAVRDTGFAVVLTLCGLRLRMRTPSLLVSSLVMLLAGLLTLSAFLLPHDSSLVMWNEAATSLLVAGLAALTVR